MRGINSDLGCSTRRRDGGGVESGRWTIQLTSIRMMRARLISASRMLTHIRLVRFHKIMDMRLECTRIRTDWDMV